MYVPEVYKLARKEKAARLKTVTSFPYSLNSRMQKREAKAGDVVDVCVDTFRNLTAKGLLAPA